MKNNDAKNVKGFTLIELLVVISIIAVLMAIMMPTLRKAREQAKDVIDKSNQRQWGLVFQMYTGDHRGYFPQGWYTKDVTKRQLWMATLRDYYGDISDLRCCPTAKNPEKNYGVFGTWGPYPDVANSYHDPEDYGSYGINEWVYYNRGDMVGTGGATGSPYPKERFWCKVGAKGSDKIPVLLDCGTYEILPLATDKPPQVEGEYSWGVSNPIGEMCRCTLNRHSGHINILFMDWSVRSVDLKDLWDLKWHRNWKVDRKPIWPEWMNKL